MKLLRRLRSKKKSQNEDESSQSDLTGIQVKVEPETKPIEETGDQAEVASIIDPEQKRNQRKNRAIQEMFARNSYLETVAFSGNSTKRPTHKPKEDSEGGTFFCICGDLGNTCGEGEENGSVGDERIRTYKMVKQSPNEKVGLSFVAFKQKSGIFVCKIKEESKFKGTDLKVGMRVISINGEPCPDRVGTLMKMLKKVEKDLALEVESTASVPDRNVVFQVPEHSEVEPAKTKMWHSKKESKASESEEPTLDHRGVDSSERRLYSSDSGLGDSEPEPESDSSENDSDEENGSAVENYNTKLGKKNRMELMKINGAISSIPESRDPNLFVPKNLEDPEGDDTDETVDSASEQNAQSKVYESDSSQGSSTFYTNESRRYTGMDRFAAMVDGLVGASQDRPEGKKGEYAPVWSFF
ncbi:MAG: hypothetical protein SGBAC_006728 [Bacillariaceae sp.]